MACSCKKQKTETAEGHREQLAPQRELNIVVRSADVPLACETCLAKHLATAAVLSVEFTEDKERLVEHALCSANLQCAADHARALGKDDLADRILGANASDPSSVLALLSGGGDMRELAIGSMSAAEMKLRLAGDPASADKVREIRLAFQSAPLGGGGGRDVEKEPAGGPSEENAKTLESRQVASVNTDPTEG